MKARFSSKIRTVSHNIFRNITATRSDRRVFERFDKKNGLIYFGAVNQHTDENIIRGFTASATHQDNHFSVGTISDYNVSIVDRSDALLNDGGSVWFNNWIIIAIDLKNNQDLPHIFFGANNQNDNPYKTLFETNSILQKINLGTFETYGEDFTSRFTIYSPLADAIQVEKLFPAVTARVISTHLWPYSVEITKSVLYVYCSSERVTTNDLTGMLNIGLWLARHVDLKIEQI